MKAVVRTGGKQYLVAQGDVIDVETLEGAAGTKVVLDDVLMVSDDEGKAVKLGDPQVKGAKVEAEVVDQHRTDKIVVFKMKRRKRYRKTQGHRQNLTKLKINTITV